MEKEKFLGNKKVEGKGTGRACGGVVIEVVFEWKLRNNVKALNYDTCPINTGGDNGERNVTALATYCISIRYVIMINSPSLPQVRV